MTTSSDYQDPDGSEWIIGVDQWGALFIVSAPNIPPDLLDSHTAEEIGIGYHVNDFDRSFTWRPGLYRVTMSFRIRPFGPNDETSEFKALKIIQLSAFGEIHPI